MPCEVTFAPKDDQDGLASGVAATGLCLWSAGFAAYHNGPALGGYLITVIAGVSVAAVSAARGTVPESRRDAPIP